MLGKANFTPLIAGVQSGSRIVLFWSRGCCQRGKYIHQQTSLPSHHIGAPTAFIRQRRTCARSSWTSVGIVVDARTLTDSRSVEASSMIHSPVSLARHSKKWQNPNTKTPSLRIKNLINWCNRTILRKKTLNTHTHAHTHARTHTHTHARTHTDQFILFFPSTTHTHIHHT